MARAKSIPDFMVASIIRRWSMGESVMAILQWIEWTNADRKHPVITSASSVARVIDRASQGDQAQSDLSVVKRLRRQGHQHLDTLDQVQDAYAKAAESAGQAKTKDEREALALRLKALRHSELIADRRLRMTGLTGQGSTGFLRNHTILVRESEAEVAPTLLEELLLLGEEEFEHQGASRPPSERVDERLPAMHTAPALPASESASARAVSTPTERTSAPRAAAATVANQNAHRLNAPNPLKNSMTQTEVSGSFTPATGAPVANGGAIDGTVEQQRAA
jgi:hypothetical protein